MDYNQDAIKQLVRGMKYIVHQIVDKSSTQVYDGVVLSEATNGKWNVQYNGKSHAIKPYKITPTINTMVKVFVPQGNQNLAFFF